MKNSLCSLITKGNVIIAMIKLCLCIMSGISQQGIKKGAVVVVLPVGFHTYVLGDFKFTDWKKPIIFFSHMNKWTFSAFSCILNSYIVKSIAGPDEDPAGISLVVSVRMFFIKKKTP